MSEDTVKLRTIDGPTLKTQSAGILARASISELASTKANKLSLVTELKNSDRHSKHMSEKIRSELHSLFDTVLKTHRKGKSISSLLN